MARLTAQDLQSAHSKPIRLKLYEARYLLLLLLPGLIFYAVFQYGPMYGILMAFKNYRGSSSIWAAEWVGLQWFEEFFNSFYFWRLLRNTLLISLYNLIFGFPIPIVFALILSETRNAHFRKIVQTVSYLPHFISVVVVVGMLHIMLSTTNGVVNNLIRASGGQSINFMGESEWFPSAVHRFGHLAELWLELDHLSGCADGHRSGVVRGGVYGRSQSAAESPPRLSAGHHAYNGHPVDHAIGPNHERGL